MTENTKGNFSITELLIIILVCSFSLALVVDIEISKNRNDINHLISNIQSYKTATYEFDRKYGFLPGDLKKTQIFELSVNNTDGNENGLIEDSQQQSGNNYYNDIYLNGEILNFWLHLYKSGFIEKTDKIFPYVDSLKSGILVFTDGENNYFHFGISGIYKDNKIKTQNNLTPNQAYTIDKKIDDGLPIEGNVFITSGNFLNAKYMKRANKKCSTEYEYLTVFNKKLCQIVIKL